MGALSGVEGGMEIRVLRYDNLIEAFLKDIKLCTYCKCGKIV